MNKIVLGFGVMCLVCGGWAFWKGVVCKSYTDLIIGVLLLIAGLFCLYVLQ